MNSGVRIATVSQDEVPQLVGVSSSTLCPPAAAMIALAIA